MMNVTIKDYLLSQLSITDEELEDEKTFKVDLITQFLQYIDYWLQYVHSHKCFIVGAIADAKIEKGMIKADKYDYINSGFNDHGMEDDIKELCFLGICVYNGIKSNKFIITPLLINDMMTNLDNYLNTGRVPKIMQDYYKEVLINGNVSYLNEFLEKRNAEGNSQRRGKSYVKTNLPPGMRDISNEDNQYAAYTRVLLIPAMIVLVYLIIIVSYIVFFKY